MQAGALQTKVPGSTGPARGALAGGQGRLLPPPKSSSGCGSNRHLALARACCVSQGLPTSHAAAGFDGPAVHLPRGPLSAKTRKQGFGLSATFSGTPSRQSRLPAGTVKRAAAAGSHRRVLLTRSLDERQEERGSSGAPEPTPGAPWASQQEQDALDDSWWWRDYSKEPAREAAAAQEPSQEGGRQGSSSQPVLEELTPARVVSYLLPAAAGLTLFSLVAQRVVLNPWVLTYTSWFFVIWPLPTAIGLGLWTLAIALRRGQKKAAEWEQLVLLAGALTWLILVPCGLFQGYVDGWPLALYVLYYAFFSTGAIVRLRLYGDLATREQDKQWATRTSRLAQIGFILSVVGGHWLAAWEAFQLERTVAATNTVSWLLLAAGFVTHWKSTFYLGRYFDRLVVPKEVVVFGPYRWVRHPIYTSYMLLFAGYCVALRSYMSLVFMLAASLAYYTHRVQLEEDLLVENFGKEYTEYRDRVKQKFIPYLY